ncbi:MAG: prepilin-type N-terminal cleavage/methylation domain-containing protein [Candidatus Omnitrophota bacterium]
MKISKRGFTLIEVMLVAAILVIALCGALELYSYCYGLCIQAAHVTSAIAESYSKMEEIRRHDFVTIIDAYNGVEFDLTQLTGTGVTAAGYVANTDSQLIEVTIDLNWTEKASRVSTYTLTSYIVNK